MASVEIKWNDHRDSPVTVRAGATGIVVSWCALAGPLAGVVLYHQAALHGWAGSWLAPVLLAGSAASILGALVYLRLRVNPINAIPRRLAAGRCGACGYRVIDLPREPDGCVVCPECGAAWEVGEGTEGQRDEGTEGER